MLFPCRRTLMTSQSLTRKPSTPLLFSRPLSTISSPSPLPQSNRESKESSSSSFQEEEAVSISNRSYWTKRIHSLCTSPGGGGVDAALRVLDCLRLRGYRPDSLNLSSILHALCDSGRFDEAHSRLLLSATAGWLPDDRTANVLLARLLHARTPLLSLAALRRLLSAKPAFVPSLTNYNRLLDQLCAHSQPLEAQRLLADMCSRGRLPNAISYTTLINGFCRMGELDDARRVFNEMLQRGVSPNALTYSVMIKGVLRKRLVEEGRELMCELWSRMGQEVDPSINSAAFANLIDSLCREGFFHEVFRIAEVMPRGKCVREEFAYGQMIDSLCRAGKHHGSSRIVYIMRKRGFTPSLVSYNSIVHGLSRERGCMRAYQLFKEGIEFGYSPSEPTYKVLVEGLCQEMDLYKAKDVAEFMLQSDAIDKTRIYNIFLSALRLVDKPSEQLNVLVSMLQKQCRPDVITLNTVIHGFCKIGKLNEAKKILDDMMKGIFCAPDVVTFTTIIRGLLDVGKVEEALYFFHNRMRECSCAPNTVTYNVVLSGFCKLHKVDEALEIFDDMVEKGFSADSTTYTVIINGLCEAGRLEEAKRFWDNVVWPSKNHDDYVYAAILRGLCCSGKLDEACDYLYELVDCGVAPGIVNYNILINHACRQDLKREAYQIVGEMRKNGLEPDSVTWRVLDKLHEKETREASMDGDQISETQGDAKETTTSVKLVDEIPPIIIEDKECDSYSEEHGGPLEGLGDLLLSEKLIEEEKIIDSLIAPDRIHISRDTMKEKPSESAQKEPLSRIARRVFGLL